MFDVLYHNVIAREYNDRSNLIICQKMKVATLSSVTRLGRAPWPTRVSARAGSQAMTEVNGDLFIKKGTGPYCLLRGLHPFQGYQEKET
jgi:hypothetical protein